MSDKSAIQWTDATWNPVRGCSVVSPGCTNCYAQTMAHNRLSGPGRPYEGLTNKHGKWNGKVRLVPELLDQPTRWKKPRMIFVNSMSDLFHPAVSLDFIDAVARVMADTPRHVYQILTKRPARANRIGFIHPWPANAWLGVSIENDDYVWRMYLLQKTSASIRWVSAEPLLGPLDLGDMDGIHWLVCGAESGPGARPMDIEWARDLRDQCRDLDVPFFMKQICKNGRKLPLEQWPEDLRIRQWPKAREDSLT